MSDGRNGRSPIEDATEGGDSTPEREPAREDEGTPGGQAYEMLRRAVDGILSQNPEAERAFESMVERGHSEERAREEIARVLLGVMYHVGNESDRLRDAGGGAELRTRCLRRLARGESARDIFG